MACTCPSSERFTAEMIALAAWANGPKLLTNDEKLVTAVAIALAESGGMTGATNSYTDLGGQDHCVYGLWQISDVHPGAAGACDPGTAARMMWSISALGSNWSAWTVYNNGRYLDYMDAARAAVDNFRGGLPGGIQAGAEAVPSGVGDFVGDIATDLATFFRWITSGDTWVRAGEAIGGAVLVLLGIVFLFYYFKPKG